MPRSHSQLSSASDGHLRAVRGWGHMPCATTRPCSEELVAVLPCPPRLRGILGQVSSTLSGSCGPIPHMAAAEQAAAEAQMSGLSLAMAPPKFSQA